ncbi:hypothetical protein BC831DRAFT_36353 [Entophlyctis helioformis]|nr:hypothetical protein BC831DRAFT_36353 [Entophlyctis helioformis]
MLSTPRQPGQRLTCVSRIAAGILCVSPRQFSMSDQSKRDALQQLDDTRQLDDPPSDPSMTLLVSPSASCVMAVNSCDSVDTVCLDYLDDDKDLAGEHGQPTVAVAATPTASRQRAPSKRKTPAAAGASASVLAVTLDCSDIAAGSPSSTHKCADWMQKANSRNRQWQDSSS